MNIDNEIYLESRSLVITCLPLAMECCSGVLPFKSVILTLPPYCNRSSTMPTSAVWHARWSRVRPSIISPDSLLSSLALCEFRELGAELFKWDSSPGKELVLSNSALGCSCRSIAFARVKGETNDVCPYITFTLAFDATMRWYTAFLLFAWTLSHICWAMRSGLCSGFGFRTNAFSAYWTVKGNTDRKISVINQPS